MGGGRRASAIVVMPQLLAYVSGGFTQARFGQVNADGPLFFLPATTYSGYFVGSGYEYGLTFLPGLFWKTEYRFAGYDRKNVHFIEADEPRSTPTASAPRNTSRQSAASSSGASTGPARCAPPTKRLKRSIELSPGGQNPRGFSLCFLQCPRATDFET